MLKVIERKALRVLVGGFQRLRRQMWRVTTPRTFGAHAVPLTPAGKIVLVKLRYARGWRLPGGGRKPDEDPAGAVLRELREEIGMRSHGSVQLAGELQENPDYRRDTNSILIVRDVRYRPRWSLEIEEITEAELNTLPPDTSKRTRRWIETVKPYL